ncbi:MAG: sigma 54-interacting transcriptional regulator, partial [Betaproteobacteria bacterium]
EFFGYRKGAFTGATEDRPGFFQAADGGLLFLDEIGDLPLPMQSKLLRVIQERAVRALGSASEVPVNVRIVSATHKDLVQEVAAGRFRQDLFYRLNVIRIVLPALRERLDDLPTLCADILEKISRDAGVSTVPRLSAAALEALSRHPFPGNVRELENLLHRAIALSGGDMLDAGDLGLETCEAPVAIGGAPPTLQVNSTVSDLVPQAPASVSAAPVPLPSDLAAYLDKVEREVLERALEKHRYNRTAAGASLGLSLRQMRYRMARLGVLSGESQDDQGS